MKKYYYLLITLLACCLTVEAQVPEKIYNEAWVASKNNAKYYRTFARENKLYKISDYTTDGHLAATGFLSRPDNDFIMNRREHFTYYDINNHKTSEGNFVFGRHNGIWKYYYNGKDVKKMEVTYNHDVIEKEVDFDELTGAVTTEYTYNQRGEVITMKTFEEGIVTSETKSDHNKYEYYPTGKLKQKTVFTNGKFFKGYNYTECGKETVFTEAPEADTANYTMPVMPFDMGEYLGTKLHYPEAARLQSIEGRVMIRFVVNEDGSISEPLAFDIVHPYIDEEAKRIIGIMPRWKPGTKNGKPIRDYYNQPIRFRLEN